MTKLPSLEKNNIKLLLNNTGAILDIITKGEDVTPRDYLPVINQYIKNALLEIILATDGDYDRLKSELLKLINRQEDTELEFVQEFTQLPPDESSKIIYASQMYPIDVKKYIEQNKDSIDEYLWLEIDEYNYRNKL